MTKDAGTRPERRHAPRVPAQGNVPGQLDLDLESEVLQLSPGGMMFDIAFPLPVGSEHRFTLNVDDHELTVKGVVRNSQPQGPEESSPRYHVSVQFQDLSQDHRDILTRFVEGKLEA